MCVERACGDPRSPVHGRGSDLCDGSRQVWTVVVAMADDSLTHWAAREPHQTRTDAETVAVRRSSDLDRGRATGTKKRNTWSENAEPRLLRAIHHTTTHDRRASTHGLPTITHQCQPIAVVDRLGRLLRKRPRAVRSHIKCGQGRS